MVKTVIVDARRLEETTDNFIGSYLVEGVPYEAEGITTGYDIAEKVAKIIGKDKDDDVMEHLECSLCSGIGGKRLVVSFNSDNNTMSIQF